MDTLFGNIQNIIQHHHGIAFLAVFAGGLISAASPCVLAAIPLVIGYVGGYSEGNKKKAALFSCMYIFGLSLTFTIFGVAASAVGQFLWFLGNWLYIGFALIAVLMGLHLMGIVSVPLPFQRTREVRTKGLLGAFLLGIVTGIVSTPCATPVLAVILTYVATEGNILYGGLLLFVYAIGHCALIFVAGLSVGITESMIRSKGVQNFSLYAKKASGLILIAVGVYFIITIVR